MPKQVVALVPSITRSAILAAVSVLLVPLLHLPLGAQVIIKDTVVISADQSGHKRMSGSPQPLLPLALSSLTMPVAG